MLIKLLLAIDTEMMVKQRNSQTDGRAYWKTDRLTDRRVRTGTQE